MGENIAMTQQALTGSSQVTTISDEENDIRQELILDFKETADWRKRLIAKYPDDSRLVQAVEILEQLIPTVGDVPSLLLLQFSQVLDNQPTDEAIDSWTRAIGFRTFPADARAFLEMFVADPERFVKR
jgi:hypothetical protein